ncbi:hypothetical protein [Leisingera caerulea]|uniref:hypothetical protein n=1 Tax=Leisingera caerulea TaxID=506591 RepID=UPI0021A794FD|nr:hypothetical protein [Leisingera caerulea]UWQ83128.1 hypothetical protein K3726_15905 [Leisingera caerulea]
MSASANKFNKIAKGKTPPPFSLRLTFEERAALEKAANGTPLGAYIRARLFDRELPKVRRRGAQPVADHAALAKVLAALGGSRLSSNLNQMARAVHTGSLPVTPDTESDLKAACADIAAMRRALIEALGLDGGGP